MSKFVMSNDDWNTLQHYAQYAWDEHQAEIGGYKKDYTEDLREYFVTTLKRVKVAKQAKEAS